ncbi:MAG: hypothetical protein AAGF27_06745 [Pseudomonadota bacterium]
MTVAVTPIDQLNAIIDANGRGGVTTAAIDLNVDRSLVSHWRGGRRKVSSTHAAAIADLHARTMVTPVENKVIEPMTFGDDDDDGDGDLSPDDAITHDRSWESLSEAAMNTNKDDVFVLSGDVSETPPVTQAAQADFNGEVWMALHEMATLALPPEKAQRLLDLAGGSMGQSACKATERTCDRLGISATLSNGHWMMDAGIILAYLLTCKAAMSAPTQDSDAA